MLKNMGFVDRLVKLVLGAVIALLYFTHQISGIAAIILGVLAVAFVVTSLFAFCPVYIPFKISTIGKKKSTSPSADKA